MTGASKEALPEFLGFLLFGVWTILAANKKPGDFVLGQSTRSVLRVFEAVPHLLRLLCCLDFRAPRQKRAGQGRLLRLQLVPFHQATPNWLFRSEFEPLVLVQDNWKSLPNLRETLILNAVQAGLNPWDGFVCIWGTRQRGPASYLKEFAWFETCPNECTPKWRLWRSFVFPLKTATRGTNSKKRDPQMGPIFDSPSHVNVLAAEPKAANRYTKKDRAV